MDKTRLEAFSDGVIAIIITIMVLDIKVPTSANFASLLAIYPLLCTYVMSFVFVAIYWNNHHHLLKAVNRISGAVLWANMHLLFWLSLIPFATRWMDEFGSDSLPVAVYGICLLCCAIAYSILTYALSSVRDQNAVLVKALGKDIKGKVSLVLYGIAIPIAFWQIWLSYTFYIIVALMWLVPDRRIEKNLKDNF